MSLCISRAHDFLKALSDRPASIMLVMSSSWFAFIRRPRPCCYKSRSSGHLTAIHWPGHSPGSMVLTTCMKDLRVLFGQDVHGPFHPALLSNRADYQASLRRLLDTEADILLEGHYGIIHGKEPVRDFIRSFIE